MSAKKLKRVGAELEFHRTFTLGDGKHGAHQERKQNPQTDKCKQHFLAH